MSEGWGAAGWGGAGVGPGRSGVQCQWPHVSDAVPVTEQEESRAGQIPRPGLLIPSTSVLGGEGLKRHRATPALQGSLQEQDAWLATGCVQRAEGQANGNPRESSSRCPLAGQEAPV